MRRAEHSVGAATKLVLRHGAWLGMLGLGLGLGLAWIAPTPAWAEPPAFAQDFTPATLQQVRSQARHQATVLAFWATDCGYCREELPRLVAWQQRHPHVRLVLVATDPPELRDQVSAVLRQSGAEPLQHWQFSAAHDATQLRYAIDRRWLGELPRSYLLRGPDMASVSGVLTEARLDAWLTQRVSGRK